MGVDGEEGASGRAAPDGRPRWASGGRLAVIATLAVLSDAATTAAFLSTGAGTERNGLLIAGLEHGIPGGALVFAATQGLLLAVAWLPLGAVSTYVAAYLAVTMGVGGGFNNAVLLVTGDALLAPLGPTWGYLAPPVAATVVAAVVVWRRHDDPNWLVVAVVAGTLLGSEAVSLVADSGLV